MLGSDESARREENRVVSDDLLRPMATDSKVGEDPAKKTTITLKVCDYDLRQQKKHGDENIQTIIDLGSHSLTRTHVKIRRHDETSRPEEEKRFWRRKPEKGFAVKEVRSTRVIELEDPALASHGKVLIVADDEVNMTLPAEDY